MKKNPDLSIIILNYNTKDLLIKCLTSLEKVKKEVDFETIVSDNGSTDGSVEMIKSEFPLVKIIQGDQNIGFAKGNNRAKKLAEGKYVLFLNSDTVVQDGTLEKSIDYIEGEPKVGALTCKIVLLNGELDKDARRSFPTPWVAFTHFSGLDRVFPKSKLFAKYWYGYLSADETCEVDVLQGAFFMVRKNILDEVGWFDEDYFLDGEDIDLCWKIKEKGWRIVYYPKVSIQHIKGATKGKKHHSFGKVTKEEKLKYVLAGVNSMEIFYKKRLWNKYPLMVSLLVVLGINFLRRLRYVKAFLT